MFANECKQITGKNLTELRKQKFEELCNKTGVKYTFVGNKPDGYACGVIEMKTCYRFSLGAVMVNGTMRHVTKLKRIEL